jgi:hypothetical protein
VPFLFRSTQGVGRILLLVSCTCWLASLASASIVYHQALPPRLAIAGEWPNAYDLFEIDFDRNGVSDVQILPHSAGVDLYIFSPARIFILSSPPPNFGGQVADIGEGAWIDGAIENEAFRWYGGGIHFAGNEYPRIGNKVIISANYSSQAVKSIRSANSSMNRVILVSNSRSTERATTDGFTLRTKTILA